MMIEIKKIAKEISPISDYLFENVANRQQQLYYWLALMFLALAFLLIIFTIGKIVVRVISSRINVVSIAKIQALNESLKTGNVQTSSAYTSLIVILKEVLNNRFNLKLNAMTDDETLEKINQCQNIEHEFKTFLDALISKVKVAKFSESHCTAESFEEESKQIVFFIHKWFK